MKKNYTNASIIVLCTIVVLNVFVGDYLFGFNTPLLIFGLGFMIYAFMKRIRDHKAYLNRKENDKEEDS